MAYLCLPRLTIVWNLQLASKAAQHTVPYLAEHVWVSMTRDPLTPWICRPGIKPAMLEHVVCKSKRTLSMYVHAITIHTYNAVLSLRCMGKPSHS